MFTTKLALLPTGTDPAEYLHAEDCELVAGEPMPIACHPANLECTCEAA